jgi:hypothetical protein
LRPGFQNFNWSKKTLLFIVLSNFKLLFTQSKNEAQMRQPTIFKRKMAVKLRQQNSFCSAVCVNNSLANQPIRGLPFLGLI